MNQGISTSKKQSFQAKAATEAFDVIALVQSRLDDLQALAEDEAEEATV